MPLPLPEIFVDGDACPFKEEIYQVAKRYGLVVHMVCNSEMRIPLASWIKPVVVGTGFDAVDDWIAEKAHSRALVITNDLLLSERCLKQGARVLDTRGRELTEENIGEHLATRELMTQLRAMGERTKKSGSERAKYRSAFLRRIDEILNALLRASK
jgi:uncharacterized protein YaiI (UPF0178 family)